MGKPIVYGVRSSPAVMSVLLTLKALRVEYEMRIVDLQRRDHKTQEFLKKNPAGTIPVLEDEEGRCIGDSHAIMAYLVGKYGQDTRSLYPIDLYERAIVDQRLHFENGELFMNCVKPLFGPIFAQRGSKMAPPEKLVAIERCYAKLEAFLGNNRYVAGAHLTIADFCCVTSVGSLQFFRPIDGGKFPKLAAWLQRMAKLEYFDEVMRNESSMATLEFLQKSVAKL